MKFKVLLLAILSAAIIPSVSFAVANITVTNNSHHPATGKIGFICSDKAGDSGVIKPEGGSLQIPKAVMDMFCSSSCKVEIYMNSNCDGSSAATSYIDYNNGITSVHTHNSQGYVFSGSGNSGQVNGGPAKWYDFFSKIFA